MTIREGEKLQNGFNGRVYVVKAVINSLVALDALEGTSWIITEKDILQTFYKRVEAGAERIDSRLPSILASTGPIGPEH